CRIPGHHRKSCPIRSLYSPVLTPHYNEAEHDGDDIEPKNRRERCRKRHPRDSGLPPVQQFQKIRQCERGHCRRSNDDEDEKKGVENGPSNGIRILLIAHVSSNLCYRAEEELRSGDDIEAKNRRERCRKRHPRDSGLPPVQQFQKIRQCERGHCRRSNDDEDEKKGVENGPSNGIRILLIAHVSSNLCYRAEEEL